MLNKREDPTGAHRPHPVSQNSRTKLSTFCASVYMSRTRTSRFSSLTTKQSPDSDGTKYLTQLILSFSLDIIISHSYIVHFSEHRPPCSSYVRYLSDVVRTVSSPALTCWNYDKVIFSCLEPEYKPCLKIPPLQSIPPLHKAKQTMGNQ